MQSKREANISQHNNCFRKSLYFRIRHVDYIIEQFHDQGHKTAKRKKFPQNSAFTIDNNFAGIINLYVHFGNPLCFFGITSIRTELQ